MIPSISIELFSFLIAPLSIERLSVCLIAPWQLPQSIEHVFAVDTFSIAESFEVLNLDTSRSIENYWASIYRVSTIQISFLSISLDCYYLFTSQNHFLSLQTSTSRIFSPRSSFYSLGKGPNPSFSCISFTWPNFLGFFEDFGVFQNWWSFCEIFGMGVFFFKKKTSCITSHLHYNTVSCILRCVFTLLQTSVLVGLDWAEPMMFLLLHIKCSCIFMHTYLKFFIFLYIDCFGAFLRVSFSLSL